ncbi:MAG: hypothetical protein HQL71_09115 [Magnetococcales bacterium]|nr:hypothetical protein [Magnetococcales bacterium]
MITIQLNFNHKKQSKFLYYFFISLFLCALQTSNAWAISLSDLPSKVLLSASDKPRLTSDIFSRTPVLIVVGSHSTTPLFTKIPLTWKARNLPILPKQFISVAAVHKAPWFVKLFLRGTIHSAKEKRDEENQKIIPNLVQSSIIVDIDGETAKALAVANLTKNEYAAFVLNNKNQILLLHRANIANENGKDHDFQLAADNILDKAQQFF